MINYPYILLGQARARLFSDRANRALADWEAEWTSTGKRSITCLSASDSNDLPTPDSWAHRTLDDGTSAWTWMSSDMAHRLGRSLFASSSAQSMTPEAANSPIAEGVARDAAGALLQYLTDALSGQSSVATAAARIPDHLSRRGSGAVICQLHLDIGRLLILLPHSTAAGEQLSAPTPRPALSSLHQAVSHLTVSLHVELSEAELSLGYLGSLAVGDVLTLPAAVDHPLRVQMPDGSTVCRAHLGARDGMRAIELMK